MRTVDKSAEGTVPECPWPPRDAIAVRPEGETWVIYEPGDTLPEPPDEQSAVPSSITRRQAKQALILAGLITVIQPAIDAIPDPVQRALMQVEWDDSQVFERHRPALLQLAGALGLTSEQIDDLFIQGAAL